MIRLRALAVVALAACVAGSLAARGFPEDSRAEEVAVSTRWEAIVKSRVAEAMSKVAVGGLGDLARDLEADLRPQYPAVYLERVSQLVNEAASWSATDASAAEKVYSILTRGLEQTDGKVSVVAWSGVAWRISDFEAPWTKESTEAWSKRRFDMARLLVRSVERVRDAIDPAWDPKDPAQQPVQRVPLPKGVSGIAGMGPEAISDPVLRKEYEDAIAANQRKLVRANEQVRLRELDKSRPNDILVVVVRMYRRPPSKSAELESLAKEKTLQEAEAARLREAALASTK